MGGEKFQYQRRQTALPFEEHMARIRHLALTTNSQEEHAKFYCNTFGMTEVFRHKSAESGKLAIYLTDGEVNLAFIPANTRPEGINHFGFQVDDVNAMSDAALSHGARSGAKAVPRDGRQNEAFITDPDGQRIDLSSAGWNIGGTGKAKIRHLALMTEDPPRLAEFYKMTFRLHEVFRRDKERGAVYLSDGYINLAVLPNFTEEAKGAPAGVNHLGFKVDDLPSSVENAYANGAKANDYTLPRDGRFAETFVFDPVGQRVDLSQAGWKI